MPSVTAWRCPQLYAEVFCPWGDGLSMKLGHYLRLFGYETVTAPDNFFYSHSYAFQYGEPFTFTGLLGNAKLGELTVQAGMNRGFNNWENENDRPWLQRRHRLDELQPADEHRGEHRHIARAARPEHEPPDRLEPGLPAEDLAIAGSM